MTDKEISSPPTNDTFYLAVAARTGGSVQYLMSYKSGQFEKYGFEKNAFEVFDT